MKAVFINQIGTPARVYRVLPLSRAAEARRLQEESTIGKSGALSGKIVLKI